VGTLVLLRKLGSRTTTPPHVYDPRQPWRKLCKLDGS
jgi:hypothetical protein